MRVRLTLHVAHQQMRAADEHAGGDRERRRAQVAGDGDLLERQLVAVDHGDVPPVAAHRDAGAGEHPLGVVAAGRGLDDRRRAVGGERRRAARTT